MISKIPEHIIAYIEGELLMYRSYKSALNRLLEDREDLINRGRQMQIVPIWGGTSDPTGEIASRLHAIDDEIQWLRRRLHRIDLGLDSLTNDERQIVDFKYFSVVRYNNTEIMDRLHLCKRAFYGQGDYIGALESMLRKFQRVFSI